MIGVSITITLKNEEKEKEFLQIFQKALENINIIEGLKEFQASQVIGKPYTYHVFSLWESEENIEKWLSNPYYKDFIRKNSEELFESFISYRWKPIREPKIINY